MTMGGIFRTVAVTTVGFWLLAAPAYAQTAAEQASRRILLDRAREARERGDHAAALESIQQASEIRTTPSLRLFMAEEEQALGQLAEALGEADLCAIEADRDTGSEQRERIRDACRALVTRLRPLVGTVTVRASERLPAGSVVHVGSHVVSSVLGVPNVAAPGTTVVRIEIAGVVRFEHSIEVHAGSDTVVDVLLAPAAPPAVTPAVTVAATPPPTEHLLHGPGQQPVPPPLPGATVLATTPLGRPFPVGGVVLLGGGLVALGGSLALFLVQSSIASTCPVIDGRYACRTPDELDHALGARTYGVAGMVTVGVGGAAAVAGLAWTIAGVMARRTEPTHVALVPSVLVSGDGVTLFVGGSL